MKKQDIVYGIKTWKEDKSNLLQHIELEYKVSLLDNLKLLSAYLMVGIGWGVTLYFLTL